MKLETYYRVMFRLLQEGWPEGMELDEAIAADPEMIREAGQQTPPRVRQAANRTEDRRRRAEAWKADLLRPRS